MTDNLEELERLLAKATPGEWASGIRDGKRAVAGGSGEWVALLPNGHRDGFGCTSDDEIQANRALIVALHNAAPSLIATAREVEGLLAEVAKKDRALAEIAEMAARKNPTKKDMGRKAIAALEGKGG